MMLRDTVVVGVEVGVGVGSGLPHCVGCGSGGSTRITAILMPSGNRR